ncbi:hypothetical protein L6164_005010 [Bauhinia variegata]|uniref:Uncharacterized protein n=1 Tax=Bauhinia variegata TaxID=167791 RepID=A0ACB9PPM2_BAUVA|nr:hypothetical protein L6164_005010 [Bauhinia variegata]
MAPNFSPGSSFSTPPEKGLYPDDYLINNYRCFDDSCSSSSFNKAPEGNTCGERVKAELGDCDSQAAVAVDDLLDRLPVDPFELNKESTDCNQDLESDFGSEPEVFPVDESHKKIGDHTVFEGPNWGGNGAGELESLGGNVKGDGTSISSDDINEFPIVDGLYDGGMVADENVEKFLTFSHRGNRLSKIDDDGQGGVPHDAMFLVLGYLDVMDLLSVEQVCKSLRDTVRTDPLLWRSIHVDQLLSVRITDDTLVKLSSRAQGTLQCLSLINCIWITDSGLTSVLQSNPRLLQLSVPGCIKLTVEGILFNLRALKSSGAPGIKLLRVSGLRTTDQQFKELKDLLGAHKYFQQRDLKPLFYRGRFSYLTCEDDRPIDIDMCPRCQKPKVVYDCPAEFCQQKHQAAQPCRGCKLCIARCVNCGRCLKDCDVYDETLFLELLCLNCWTMDMDWLMDVPDEPVQEEATKCTIISQSTMYSQSPMYRFCLYG